MNPAPDVLDDIIDQFNLTLHSLTILKRLANRAEDGKWDGDKIVGDRRIWDVCIQIEKAFYHMKDAERWLDQLKNRKKDILDYDELDGTIE